MRWLKFNAVGAMGMVVHLVLLALFVHVFAVRYLWAAGLSVEIAVLHNFVWRRRWTWADRSEFIQHSVGAAVLRFNLTNGLVSLTSTLFSVYVLTGFWHLDPILSNIVSFVPCCISNFLLSGLVVFRRQTPTPNRGES